MAGRRDVEAGSAYVRLWMKSSEFDRGVRTLKRDLTGIGRDLTRVGGVIAGAGTAIVGSITAAAVSFAGFGDTLNKMAIRTGVSTEALSELKFAAEQSGASLEVVEKGIRKMQQTIGEAANGSQSYIDALGNIGLSLDKLSGKSPEDQFMLIAERVAAISDPTMRAAAALEIFGRSGTQLLPLMTGDVRKLREEARKLGLTMSGEDAQAAADLTDAMNRMWKSMEAAWNKVGAAVAPMLETLADRVASIAVTSQEWIKANGEVIVTLLKVGAGLAAVGTALIAFGQLAYGAAAAVGALTAAMTFMAAHPVAIVIAGFVAAASAIAYFESTAQRLPSVMGDVRKKSDEMRAADQALMKELSGLSEKQKLTNDEMSRANEIIDTLEGRYGDLGLSIDGTTGKIDGMADAQAKLNEAMKRAAVGQLRAEAQALEAEIAGMEVARDTWWGDVKRGASSWAGGDAGANEAAKIQAQYARLDALRARIRAAEGGDTDALTAGATSSSPGTLPSVAPPAGYDFDNMEPGEWDKVDFEQMGREADAFFAKMQANQGVEDATKRLEIEQGITDEREKQRRLIELEREIALRDAGPNGPDVDTINRYYDAKQAGLRAGTDRANQQIIDDTERLKIEQSITDEKEKQRRLIEFEREIALREGGADADKINAYYDTRLAGIKDAVKQQAGIGPSGTFSTAAAAAMTGKAGGSPEERTAKGVEAIAKGNTSLVNLLGRLVGLTESQTDELKKIFSFG